MSDNSSFTFEVTALPENEVRDQELQRAALRQSLGRVTKDEAKQRLRAHEEVKPEAELDAAAAASLRRHLSGQ